MTRRTLLRILVAFIHLQKTGDLRWFRFLLPKKWKAQPDWGCTVNIRTPMLFNPASLAI